MSASSATILGQAQYSHRTAKSSAMVEGSGTNTALPPVAASASVHVRHLSLRSLGRGLIVITDYSIDIAGARYPTYNDGDSGRERNA